jgi:hypothetical protein
MRKLKLMAFYAMTFHTVAHAQVKFKVERLLNTRFYMVSAVPDTTYKNPMNLVSTAQVTLKVPTGGFEVKSIQQFGTRWAVNGRANAPRENAEFDYISFGLRELGTAKLSFQKSQPIPLFAFEASGFCGESNLVELMDNKTDALKTDNELKINVGNQITVLGAGGDAWKGNVVGESKAPCFEMTAIEKAASKNRVFIAPNPVTDEANIVFTGTEQDAHEGTINVYDALGQLVLSAKKTFNQGLNQHTMDMSALQAGSYQLEVLGLKQKRVVEKLIKIN